MRAKFDSSSGSSAAECGMNHPVSAIILAAGKGTRMKSDLPKVAHRVHGHSMVEWVAGACADAGCTRIVVVVGYQQQVVRDIFATWKRPGVSLEFAVQDEQLGTGHAVRCAESLFAKEKAAPGYATFVLAGDGPLIRAATLSTLLRTHREARAAATLATSVIDDPSGYGRIVRDASGKFTGIIEQKNASPAQLAIREVNPSYYCFDAARLFDALSNVKRDAISGEYYITDVPALMLSRGERVEVIDAVPPQDVLSINTPEQLAEVDQILKQRGPALAPAGGGAA